MAREERREETQTVRPFFHSSDRVNACAVAKGEWVKPLCGELNLQHRDILVHLNRPLWRIKNAKNVPHLQEAAHGCVQIFKGGIERAQFDLLRVVLIACIQHLNKVSGSAVSDAIFRNEKANEIPPRRNRTRNSVGCPMTPASSCRCTKSNQL